jgi:hypothetical protein
MEEKKQNYWHKKQIASRHCRDMKSEVKMYQRICFEEPAIERRNQIIEDKYCRNTCRHVYEKVKIIVQDAIPAIDDEYLLNE